jgi:cytochrome c
MRLSAATLVLFAALSACSKPADTPAEPAAEASTAAPSAPAAGEPTDAAAEAMLASLPAPYNAADLANGKKQFARCRSCHTLGEGQAEMTGPNLHGLFGRKAGTHGGYNYSDALKAAGFNWDYARLDEWIENPREDIPGTKMSFAGLKDEEDRRDLIAWLKTQTG